MGKSWRVAALNAMLLLACACSGTHNLASCPPSGKTSSCSPLTGDEAALHDLNEGDFAAAIDQLNSLLGAEPEGYQRLPLLASAYAAQAGLQILNVVRVQFGSGSSLLDVFSTLVPTPKTVGAAAYPAHIASMLAAVNSLQRIPAELRANATASPYAASAILQLTLYQVAYSVMYLNQFAIDAGSGQLDPERLKQVTPEQAERIIDNFVATGSLPALGSNTAVQAQVQATVAAIMAEPGDTTKDKLAAYLAAKKAGGG